MFLADVEEGYEAFFYLLQLSLVFLVGIFQFLECPCRVNVVSWVYAHLLAAFGGDVGHVGVEMYVGYEWRHDSLCL